MLKRLLFFIFYFYLCFPVPAIAVGSVSDAQEPTYRVGDFFMGPQVLVCMKGWEFDKVINYKLPARQTFRLFKPPHTCRVTKVHAFLLELRRKFKDKDGDVYWKVGVGNDDGKVLFYISVPAEIIKRAP